MFEFISPMNCKNQFYNKYSFFSKVERSCQILWMNYALLEGITIELLESMSSKTEVHSKKELKNIYFKNS